MTQISNPPTIKDFLLARIAEDEAALGDLSPDGTLGCVECGFIDGRRILAEIAAKRAIIAAHDPDDYQTDLYVSEPLLCTLAAVYSDHPDYRQEWAV